MNNIFSLSFFYGVSLSIIVGPIAIIIINNGIIYGRIPALKSAFGAAIADLVYIVIAFIGSATLINLLKAHSKELQFTASFLILNSCLWLKINFYFFNSDPKERKKYVHRFFWNFFINNY